MVISRRHFFALASTSAVGTLALSPLEGFYARLAHGQTVNTQGYGPLLDDPAGILDLPAGFKYRILTRTGDRMSDGTLEPGAHDGMAAFSGPNNTTVLVRNHELGPTTNAPVVADKKYDAAGTGGTTTVIVGPNRKLLAHYVSLAGTFINCAGGPTPWGSWISCEETFISPQDAPQFNLTRAHGYNFEVPSSARGPVEPVPLVAMGRFVHEAIAVDPKTGIVYQTEDDGESLFYRFIPKVRGKLAAGGVLEALKIKDMPQAITKTGFPLNQPMAVEWVQIEDFDPIEDTTKVEGFSKGAAQFARGEGIWFGNGELYFCSTSGGDAGKGQVWRYVPGKTSAEGGTIELFVEPRNGETKVNGEPLIEAPDNITVSPFGDLFLCEDGGGTNSLVGVTTTGGLYEFARNALNESEFAGACFSPDGRTMFVNIQTPGITLAIWGPWLRRR
jgi:uncharacterized protein